jgi:hypothetical protein
LDLAGKIGIKSELLDVSGRHLGFTFLIGRMTEFLAPDIQLFQLRLSPEQSGKVDYERERLLGIANK